MANVYISHHSGDRELVDELHAELVDAGHEVFLDFHARDGIPAGDQWELRLHERLRWADAVVCVLTAAFAASAWCAAEVGVARSRGSRLIPLTAESGVRYPLLDAVQHLDYSTDRSTTRRDLLEALRQLDVAGGRSWPDDRSPYPGLTAFDSSYHRVFFGRSREIDDVTGLLRDRSSAAGAAHAPVLLVVGPSGCGKSSLVRAGVLPAMAAEPDWWVLPPIVPDTNPAGELAVELVRAARELHVDRSLPEVRERLISGRLHEVVTELLVEAPGRPRRLLVVIDQFEELLTRTAEAERREFAAVLASARSDAVRVVATLRPEFLDPLLSDPTLAVLGSPPIYAVRPLRDDQLAGVIARPAELAGLTVDAGLVERMVADTGGGDALPLLAYTLAELAQDVRRGGTLRARRYDELGGVQGALRRQADHALIEATAASGRGAPEVLGELLRLVSVDEQGHPTRWRLPRTELSETAWTELAPFVGRRLVVTDRDDEGVVVEVAHEAFLSSWPPLAEAITDASTALKTRGAIEAAAADWEAGERPAERLWERGRLAAAVADIGAREQPFTRTTWRTPRRLVTDRVDVSARARSFLHASIRRDRRLRRRSVAVLSALLVVALLGAAGAVLAAESAADQRDQAVYTKLVAQSDQLREVDTTLSAQLALTAYRMRPDPGLRARLLSVGNGPLSQVMTGHSGQVNEVVATVDGRLVASGGEDGAVRLWDVSDPAKPRATAPPLAGHPWSVNALALSSERRLLASGGRGGTLLWSLADPAHPVPIGDALPGGRVNDLAISPDGRLLAIGDGQGVQLWGLDGPPTPLGPRLATEGAAASLAFTPDGTTVAVADGTQVRFWDVADPANPTPMPLLATDHGLALTTLTISPDGRTLATGSGDRSIRLWDLTARDRIAPVGPPLQEHTDFVNGLAFSPDGRTLASAGGDRVVRLWTVADPAAPVSQGPALTGHGLAAMDVAFLPGGRGLVSVGKDAAVRLWQLPTTLLTGHTDYPNRYANDVVFRPDGRVAAIGNAENTARLWDTADPSRPEPLSALPPLHTAYVNGLAFSPDGRVLATGSEDRSVRLWNVTEPRRPTPLGPPLPGQDQRVFSLAFSPDGRSLAAGDEHGTVRFWDVTDPGRPLPHATWAAHEDSVNALAFSPVSRLLATASGDYTARLWDLTTPGSPAPRGDPLNQHSLYVNAADITPDGRTLVTASGDQTVRLFDLTDPGRPTPLGVLPDATNPLFATAISPDGSTVAAAGSDRSVWLWDVSRPDQAFLIGPLAGATDSINGVAFAPDGRVLLAASWDQTARVWDLDDDRVARRICSAAGGPLDRQEWNRYVSPDLSYDPPCGEV